MNAGQRKTDTLFGAIGVAMVRFWNFIDERDIDKHVVSVIILLGTWRLTRWAMEFASLMFTTQKSGTEIAAVIAAVTAPYMALQAAAIAFYFRRGRDGG